LQGVIGEEFSIIAEAQEDMEKHPILANTHEYFEMTVAEKQHWWFRKLNYIWFNMPDKKKWYLITNPCFSYRMFWLQIHFGEAPGIYHWVMVHTAVLVCSDDE